MIFDEMGQKILAEKSHLSSVIKERWKIDERVFQVSEITQLCKDIKSILEQCKEHVSAMRTYADQAGKHWKQCLLKPVMG
ncbi:MAG: hypothetical protein ACLTCI_09715 [[Clostridium] nexile]